MRITFVLPHANLSGGTRVVAVYSKLLAERGHRVCVVSARLSPPTLRDRLRALSRGRVLPWANGHEPSHMDGLKVEHRILDRARPLQDSDVPDADVIVATWWETAEWIRGLSACKGAQAYFIQHDETVFFPPEATDGRRRVEATWHLPIQKFAVAQWLADLGVQRGVADPIAVVPNAVDHDLFHAPPRGKQPRPTVGLMYSTTPFKGCDIAISAIRQARQGAPDLHVRAFGLDEPSPSLPLPPGAEFSQRPPQERIAQIYASCDAWLFSSRSEGFGLPILEAMACRTPVIGTPAGPAPDLIGAGGGIVVRPEDPADMARAIGEVASMSDVSWRALSDAAFKNASRFTWGQSTDLLEQTLRMAIDRSHTAGAARTSSAS